MRRAVMLTDTLIPETEARFSGARAVAGRRLLAFTVDWLVMVMWGSAVFLAVTVAIGGIPARPDDPWQAQIIGFVTMTIPAVLYFAVCESSAMQASVGKRILGLIVSGETGKRLSVRSALLRNTVKLAPWEFGHTVAQQAAFSSDAGLPVWVWAPAAIAFLGPVCWVAAIVVTGRAPYDHLARARVERLADRGSRPSRTTRGTSGG